MPSTLIRKINVVWSGLPGTPYFSQFMIGHEAGQATPAAAAVRGFLVAMVHQQAQGLTAQIQSDQTIIDTATGKPVSQETSANQLEVPYDGTGDIMPTLNQVVIRLKTSVYNNGARLQGKVYIPGCRESSNIGGLVTSAEVANYNAAAANLITASATVGKWAVWSRKYKSWASIESASTWNQWSSQKSRRL